MALVFVIARFLPPIPLGNQGYVNVGDSIIYLAAWMLPTPYAVAAGAIGAALSDLTYGYVMWVIPTLVVKALLVLTAKGLSFRSKYPVFMIALSGVTGVVGYYLAEVLLIRFFIEGGAGWSTAFVGAAVSVPGNILQGVASGVLFVVLAKVFKTLKK